MRKFDVISDPGHAWCKVPRKLLCDLGIINKITRYSYQRGGFVYLEEDCDLSTFVQAMRAAGRVFSFRERVAMVHESRVRRYEGFSVTLTELGSGV